MALAMAVGRPPKDLPRREEWRALLDRMCTRGFEQPDRWWYRHINRLIDERATILVTPAWNDALGAALRRVARARAKAARARAKAAVVVVGVNVSHERSCGSIRGPAAHLPGRPTAEGQSHCHSSAASFVGLAYVGSGAPPPGSNGPFFEPAHPISSGYCAVTVCVQKF